MTATEKRTKPLLGHIKLVKLMPRDIQRLLKVTSEKRLDGKSDAVSQKTVKNTFIIIKSALEYARRSGYIDINPAAAVRPPKVPKYVSQALTVEQVFTFLALAKQTSKYYLFYLLALSTGLRRGELLALQWQDINFSTGHLAINKALVRGKITITKSNTSNRVVGLPKDVLAELIEAKAKSHSDYIFVNDRGSFYDASNIRKRDFKPLLKAAGLPESTRLHDLRHTHASLLLESGVDLKHISEQLGHSGIGITMDLYTHILNRDSTTEKLNKLFEENSRKTP